ncbi:hypothetical protein [Paeniglutamicibacter psychrophenolicus]|uniref:hypothetical protein n=1 Tax=Paeniglutamicibacter psychrophenolicus TaxID=257454 RepID=UPI0027885B37|nr:hypothetical protein [Paeniglutamicibacter psychrophenolicus]MDQ0095717.1 hypothetical protein [Paeniglutamicibacter psychrophenolicus]
MSSEERVAWVGVASGSAGMLVFVALALIHALGDGRLAGQNYTIPMILCVFVMVAPVWIVRGLLARGRKKTDLGPDERDRDIARRADQAKFQVLLFACVVVLSMAFTGTEHFWIASTVFAGLGFSLLVGAGVQIAGYRRGVPTW